MGRHYTVQGRQGRGKTPTRIPIRHRVVSGVARRARERVLSQDYKLRRLPFGLAKGIYYRVPIYAPDYRYLGLFEYEISGYLRDICQPGKRCWDIGGQDGYYALIFAKLTGTRVLSFEAIEERCEGLRKACAVNPGPGDLVDVRHAFIGSGEESVSLDDLQEELGAPDLVKIDIEGGEADTLRGAQKLMETERPNFVIETHSARLEGECTDLLLDAGYLPRIVSQRRWLRETRPIILNRWIIARP